jgi:Ion channel
MRQSAVMAKHHAEPIRRLGGGAEHRYGVVLALLLGTFVLMMTGTTGKWARPLSVALTGTTLVAALLAAGVAPRLRRIAEVCAVVAFLGSLTLLGLGRSGAGFGGVLNAALVIVAPIAIARSVLRRRIVDVRTVLAALCIYVLFAMWWAFVYTAIGNIGPSAFFVQQTRATSADYLYFSFITQLTVGYGDLTAVGNLGRACAVLEGLLGQIYLVTIVAVLVSRLVPANAANSPSRDEPGANAAP